MFGEQRTEFLGLDASEEDEFPFVVKRIDAGADLSVQVHPGAEAAARMCGARTGKAEAWVILDAAPGAVVYLGFEPGVDAGQIAAAAREGDVSRLLRAVPVAAGDVIPVPPGCVHAIGGGIVLFEAQEPLDMTFRLDDWGRPHAGDASPRELHVAEALAVLDPELRPEKAAPATVLRGAGIVVRELCALGPFRIERWDVKGRVTRTINRLHVLQCMSGEVILRTIGGERIEMARGDTVVVAARSSRIYLEAARAELLVVAPRRDGS